MIRNLAAFAFAASLAAAPAFAADVVVDLVNSDPDDPGGGWSVFNAAQGTAGKPFVFRFVSADASALPLTATGTCALPDDACVRLTPGTSAPFSTPKECALLPGPALEPELDAITAGQCFYRLSSSFGYTEVVIYHLALLETSANIRVEIANLTPALPFHSFVDFDTNAAPNGPPQPIAARPLANLVLVVDKSGSMGWSNNPSLAGCGVLSAPPPGCEPSRWDVLIRGLEQMATVAKAYVLPGDEIGAVAFDSSAQVVQNLIGATGPTIDGIVSTIDNTLSPGGATSIGDGVDQLAAALAANAGQNNMMLLFSDGVQNNPFFLRLVGNTVDNKVLRINEDSNNDVGSNVRDVQPNFDLCVFALRAEGTADPLDLQGISNVRCNGLNAETTSVDPSEADLIVFFLQVLNEALIGDKLELADIARHQLVADTGDRTIKHSFVLGRESIGFTTALSWAREGNGLETMSLEKDGVIFRAFDAATTHRTDRGRDHWAMTLRSPACGLDPSGDRVCLDDLGGEWTMVAQPFFEVSRVFDAKTVVVTDNASLASVFSVEEAAPGLGQPLDLSATLTEAGKPLTGLPPGAVQAVVRAPGGNRGDVLARLKVQPKVGQPDVDPITPAAQKALTALGDPILGAELRKALSLDGGMTVDLLETAPGVYSASAGPADFEGVYSVTFRVDAPDSPSNGPFHRVFRTSFVKSVQLDEAATLASITSTPAAICSAGSRCFTLRITPQDATGVLVGPNFAPVIAVGGEAQQLGAVTDRLDGSYEVVAACPDSGACTPTISVRGAEVNAKLPDGDGGPRERWVYDAKMLCGVAKEPDGPVAPSGYRTLVNVMATERPTRVTVRFAPALPKGKSAALGARRTAPGQAFAIDCDALSRVHRSMRGGGFVDGILTLSAGAPLTVSAVYTAGGPRKGPGVGAPSLEIRTVRPRRER